MPTHFLYRYKIVTSAGEFSTSSKEPIEDIGLDSWIKENQSSINSRFESKAGNPPVKVTAIYSVKADGTAIKIWGN